MLHTHVILPVASAPSFEQASACLAEIQKIREKISRPISSLPERNIDIYNAPFIVARDWFKQPSPTYLETDMRIEYGLKDLPF